MMQESFAFPRQCSGKGNRPLFRKSGESFPSGEPYDTAVAAGTENSDLEAQISCSTGASADRRAVYPRKSRLCVTE